MVMLRSLMCCVMEAGSLLAARVWLNLLSGNPGLRDFRFTRITINIGQSTHAQGVSEGSQSTNIFGYILLQHVPIDLAFDLLIAIRGALGAAIVESSSVTNLVDLKAHS